MIDIKKYRNEKRKWKVRNNYDEPYNYEDIITVKGNGHYHYTVAQMVDTGDRDAELMADAPLLLEFIQKIVKEWCKPNQCNQAFGKDVRQLMYEYGLITFNEETRRYEVK